MNKYMFSLAAVCAVMASCSPRQSDEPKLNRDQLVHLLHNNVRYVDYISESVKLNKEKSLQPWQDENEQTSVSKMASTNVMRISRRMNSPLRDLVGVEDVEMNKKLSAFMTELGEEHKFDMQEFMLILANDVITDSQTLTQEDLIEFDTDRLAAVLFANALWKYYELTGDLFKSYDLAEKQRGRFIAVCMGDS